MQSRRSLAFRITGKEFISLEFKNVRSFGQIARDRFKIVVRWAHYSQIHRRRRLVVSVIHQYVVIRHYAVRRSSAITRALPRELALRLRFADTQLITSPFGTASRDKFKKASIPVMGLMSFRKFPLQIRNKQPYLTSVQIAQVHCP